MSWNVRKSLPGFENLFNKVLMQGFLKYEEIEITRWTFEAQIGFVRQGSNLKHFVILSNLKWQAHLIYRHISFFES